MVGGQLLGQHDGLGVWLVVSLGAAQGCRVLIADPKPLLLGDQHQPTEKQPRLLAVAGQVVRRVLGQRVSLGLADIEHVGHPEVDRSALPCLLNTQHVFGFVTQGGVLIVPLLGLGREHRRQNGDAMLALFDMAAERQPGVESARSGRIGALGENQKCVAHGVFVELCLGLEKPPPLGR